MSNFTFIQDEWSAVFTEAREAEQLTLISPKACAVFSRSALEKAVLWLYHHESALTLPYDTRLSSLIHLQSFRDLLAPGMFREINLIRLNGNNGAHGRNVSRNESIASIKNLFRFLSFLNTYYGESTSRIPAFDESLLPDGEEEKRTKAAMQQLTAELEASTEALREERRQREALAAQNTELKEALEKERETATLRRREREQQQSPATAVPQLISEDDTRKLYIDVLLKEAGWDNLRDGREKEYPVTGMPEATNPNGKGRADYVLWDDDGKPLAVIEAKKTMIDAYKGRHQATQYADCLQKMHGRRPVMFYTNGFETFIWDDQFYVDREVSGFYSKEELKLMIQRRSSRRDLRTFSANNDIIDRPYQIEALQRVAEALAKTAPDGSLRGAARAALLVMATGSGKTRTAAAIVDMLSKCNWVKRVLFLADRNALVTQAKNAFNELLPHLSAVDLTKSKEDYETRLVFSTYPTIMNKIDSVKAEDRRFYGVGHFDLIIIDEAHRSVYQKYRAIFEYFDALLIGLTATPKTDIDRNTYGLFGIEDNNPTFAYELDKAVSHGYLVPPKSISVPLKFQREGIKYAELSAAEKEEYEEKFGDPTIGEAPDFIDSSALNNWLFNSDTVDKVLEHLIQNGIKVQGGDRLGKTIVFAKNHKHACFIEQRFNKNYPEYGGTFLRVIDSHEPRAQDLLEKFTDKYSDSDPQIAVSVDMMDTGIDAWRVVNLVFFKVVRSASKFWQMIGRGTRLCPDLFGPGEHKTEYLIFDYCENFEFFNEFPDGAAAHTSKPLLQRIFEAKLTIAMLISDKAEKSDAEKEVRDTYLSDLQTIIAGLDKERFAVRKQLRHVEEFSRKERWQNLSAGDVQIINDHLSHLQPVSRDDTESARRFDLLVLALQIDLLSGKGKHQAYIGRISSIAAALQKKDTITAVAHQMPLIREVQTSQYWQTIHAKKLEELRLALRNLLQHLESRDRQSVHTHFEDELDYSSITVRETLTTYVDLESYRERVENYIRERQHHLAIHNLRNNIPITAAELQSLEKLLFIEDVAGSREDFVKEYGEQPLGAFIRRITGLDREAVQQAFADFIQTGNLTADQMSFIDMIITHLSKNGVIDKKMLFEAPFTNLHDQGISGVFPKQADVLTIAGIIDGINENAAVA